MTRDETKQLLPIIRAYAEGKTIQMEICGEWVDLPEGALVCDFVGDADAHLIAAAPEILEALKDAAKIINGMFAGTLPPCFAVNLETVNTINRAIARAEGK
jgi:hypothetical protein